MSCLTISLGRTLGAVSGCESSPWEPWDHDHTNSDWFRSHGGYPRPSSLSHGWPKFNVRKSVVTDPPWLSMKPPSQRCQALMFFVYLFFWIFEPLPISSPVAEAAKKWWWTFWNICYINGKTLQLMSHCRISNASFPNPQFSAFQWQVFKSYLLLKTIVCLLFATLMSVLWQKLIAMS